MSIDGWIVNQLDYGQAPAKGLYVFLNEVDANKEASIRRVLAIKTQASYKDEPPKHVQIHFTTPPTASDPKGKDVTNE